LDVDARSRIDDVADRCARVLRGRPRGIFSDFDGTLSEIASTPQDAVAYVGAREALQRVLDVADVAGIITGRAVADVQVKVGVPALTVVGNHGLEWFDGGQHVDHEAGVAAQEAIREALFETEKRLKAVVSTDGMIWENKRLTASIHFRNSDDPVEVGMALLPIIQEEASRRGLRVSSGKMLVELRPLAVVSKGTALEQLVRTRGLKSAIFLGDDVTDVDGFRALHRLRDDEGISTMAVAIRSEDVHPEVISESDVVLESVAESVAMLNRLADMLGSEG
jgi:trehalose 6-phosphate phosphatase